MSSILFRLYVRIGLCPSCVHDISCHLPHRKRKSTAIGVDRNHSDTHKITWVDYLGWRRDPSRNDLADVDKPLDAHRHASERPVWHDACHCGVEVAPNSKLTNGARPRILLQPLNR